MDVDCIPLSQTGYFSQLIVDYLNRKETLDPFYQSYPDNSTFKAQILAKQQQVKQESRHILHRVLTEQYEGIRQTGATTTNIDLLRAGNTFTVVTGHQLNLFTGPLYFLYKIISAIKLCTHLRAVYPEYNFVPVYWMATEDHDFEEINHFTFKGKKLRWNRESSGAVGRLDTKGLQAVFETFIKEMGRGDNAQRLEELFKKAYLEHTTLTGATRYLANALFGSYGLVVIDGDHQALKKQLIPYIKKDILEGISFQNVSESIAGMQEADQNYGIQVNPREINYFYLEDGIRERIESRNGSYHVLNTGLSFSENELLAEIEQYPERFSPNVIARPLFQEVILPNLCYIGGGGELAYWLELKAMFDAMQVSFPLLLLRNSALLISKKQDRKLKKLNIETRDLFLSQNRLINKKIREISNIDIDFSPQRNHLKEQFAGLYRLAEQTDKSFLGAVRAQEVKQLKGLDKLEKRLLKAQKRKLRDHVVRLSAIHNELFPGEGLQERQQNFSEFYLQLSEDLIPMLMDNLQVFPSDFMVLRY